jgi:peptide-N-glycosidase F-like protein
MLMQRYMRGLMLVLFVSGAFGCSTSGSGDSADLGAPDSGSGTGGVGDSADLATAAAPDLAASDPGAPDAGSGGTGGPGSFNLFDQVPQFGIYNSTDPSYTPPSGILMWSHGTEFVTQLSPAQQAQIGSDLAARITYIAQCDDYDRLGGIFFVLEPKGQAPQPTDARTELVRFITPFSDYRQGTLATHVYPNADLSPFAATLADATHDVWIGIAGGSNPYDGDPCTNAGVPSDYAAVGFKYSLDFVSTKPLAGGGGASVTLAALGGAQQTATPIAGTFANPGGSVSGHVTVIVSGHGSAAGGDEYRYTQDTLTLNGQQIGAFSTQIDCAPYAQFSPRGNPGIFRNNTTNNPRNWCPGALVPSHSFAASLTPGSNAVTLAITPGQVPSGSYYATSLTFSAP